MYLSKPTVYISEVFFNHLTRSFQSLTVNCGYIFLSLIECFSSVSIYMKIEIIFYTQLHFNFLSEQFIGASREMKRMLTVTVFDPDVLGDR